MVDFKVDNEKCIGCNQCVVDCPVMILEMKNRLPILPPKKEQFCISCMHCFAVCGEGAISIDDHIPSDENIVNKDILPNGEQVAELIRGRRSVRRYQDRNLDKDVIDDLLFMANQAPTGRNRRGLNFGVVYDKEVMADLREKVISSLELHVENETLPEVYGGFGKFPAAWREHGIDVMFQKAPHLLVVSAHEEEVVTPIQDATIAMTTFELYAQSQGLGTLWNGLATLLFKDICPELMPLLNIPENHNLCYIMCFGHPSLRYKRVVNRGAANFYKIG